MREYLPYVLAACVLIGCQRGPDGATPAGQMSAKESRDVHAASGPDAEPGISSATFESGAPYTVAEGSMVVYQGRVILPSPKEVAFTIHDDGDNSIVPQVKAKVLLAEEGASPVAATPDHNNRYFTAQLPHDVETPTTITLEMHIYDYDHRIVPVWVESAVQSTK